MLHDGESAQVRQAPSELSGGLRSVAKHIKESSAVRAGQRPPNGIRVHCVQYVIIL
jgi:hypothetical protein